MLLLPFSEVAIPSFIVVNLAVDGYFFPSGAVETEQHLLDFLDGVLNGSIEVARASTLLEVIFPTSSPVCFVP